MGLCMGKALTPEEKKEKLRQQTISKQIEKDMRRDHATDVAINKLLLLGSGESGKSTLFKQMVQIYGKGFDDAERKKYVSVIHNNVIESIKTLCLQTERLAPQEHDDTLVSPHLREIKNQIMELKKENKEGKEMDGYFIDPPLAENIAALWADPGIQRTYELRARYQLTDSAKYYFDKVREIAKPNYLPSLQDVLRSRVRTTGIVEQDFIIDDNYFKIFDVGGQRSERKKWIHCFQDVTALLFVVALSEYDLVLFEDETTNRMDEALKLFEDIVSSHWFHKTSVILFLNKRDLFAEKIRRVPLKVCFPNYDGEDTYEEAYKYVEEEFIARAKKRNRDKIVYPHLTCATDTDQMKHVFNVVKDIVIRKSLAEGGLMA